MLALGTHYRSSIGFGPDKIKEAESAYERLLNVRRRIAFIFDIPTVTSVSENLEAIKKLEAAIVEAKTKFIESMDDDFNTAAAIAALFELVKEINTLIEAYGEQPTLIARDALVKADEMLIGLAGSVGLSLLLPEASGVNDKLSDDVYALADEVLQGGRQSKTKEMLLDEIIERRNQARKEKEWAVADKIRNEFAQMGIEIEDTPLGSRWKLK
jgi:cysteinyl-tRNA synthetase